MTRALAKERVPDSAWTADHVRCSLFYPPAEIPNLAGVWERVTGEPPESVSSKPKVHEHMESGPWSGGYLVLHGQRGRIDWQFGPGDDPDAPRLRFPDRVTPLLNLVNRWIEVGELPTVVRLAFGSAVQLPVPDIASGYRVLCDYLPFDISRAESSDFFYQINRPRPSAIGGGLVINRLTKWCAIARTAMRLTMQLTDGAPPIGTVVPHGDESFCSLELDINTVPRENAGVGREIAGQVFMELVTLAREIIREGDIP